MFVQSQVPEHAELHLLLSMVTPLGWLERVPTYKEQLENIKDKDLHTYGFLGYPVLQCGDIVMYGEPGVPLVIPVGEDQVSHVEISREIVRKFNFHNIVFDAEALARPENAMAVRVIRGSFDPSRGPGVVPTAYAVEEIQELESLVKRRIAEVGFANYLEQLQTFSEFKAGHNVFRKFLREVLAEPEAMLTQTPRIPGLDERKMSKSYGNAIELGESDESILAKTKVMMTDPARKRRTDKGNPDVCPVYDWHKLFSPQETLKWANQGCRTAGIGCIECKTAMADNLIKWIKPIRERRQRYESTPEIVREILRDGSAEAQKVAWRTMRRVRDAVFGPDRLKRPTRVKRLAQKRLGVGH